MQSNGTRPDALTDSDDIAGISTEGRDIVTDPFKCSTLVSQPVVRCLCGYQRLIGAETEYS